jgi:hypothetical protein
MGNRPTEKVSEVAASCGFARFGALDIFPCNSSNTGSFAVRAELMYAMAVIIINITVTCNRSHNADNSIFVPPSAIGSNASGFSVFAASLRAKSQPGTPPVIIAGKPIKATGAHNCITALHKLHRGPAKIQ